MATHVYANGQEIACKATDGTAPAAFPDPCWSPPPPPAGPVVIPYANFTTASKIRNGTRSVFIKGQTVALENKSYFVNSTGNEPATYAFGKGLITGALKGKAHFQSWSLDVVFEGRGVARNLDLVTHNHGSDPSNTAPFPYISRNSPEDVELCAKDKERIERNCTGEGKYKSGEHWTDKHCKGLTGSRLNSRVKAQQYAKDLPVGNNPTTEVRKSSLTAGFKKLRDVAKGPSQLSVESQEEILLHSQKIAADQQSKLANLDACIRARKCQLVPYNRGAHKQGKAPSTNGGCCPGQTGHHLIYDSMIVDRDENRKVIEGSSKCPGKPKNKETGEEAVKGYDTNTAPTVCVEGTSQHMGSHGRVHRAMDKEIRRITRGRKPVANSRGKDKEIIPMTIDEAIEAAVNSHTTAFRSSRCNPKCIEAQLRSYYSGMCDGETIQAKTG